MRRMALGRSEEEGWGGGVMVLRWKLFQSGSAFWTQMLSDSDVYFMAKQS